MSHWCHTMVNGAKFWISYQQLAFLSGFSCWQLIINLAPSTIVWRQCDIQIVNHVFLIAHYSEFIGRKTGKSHLCALWVKLSQEERGSERQTLTKHFVSLCWTNSKLFVQLIYCNFQGLLPVNLVLSFAKSSVVVCLIDGLDGGN